MAKNEYNDLAVTDDIGTMPAISSWNEATRQFSTVVVTGARTYRFQRYDEETERVVTYDDRLLVTNAAVDRGRFDNMAPLVVNHSDDVEDVLGRSVPGSLSIDDATQIAIATWQVASDAALDERKRTIVNAIREGSLPHFSVRYRRIEAVLADRSQWDGDVPLYIVTRWEPIHHSVVSAGYNDDAISLSLESSGAGDCADVPAVDEVKENLNGVEKNMGVKTHNESEAPAEFTPDLSGGGGKNEKDLMVSAIARVREIMDRGAELGLPVAKVNDLVNDVDLSVGDAAKKMLDMYVGMGKANQVNGLSASIATGGDERNKMREALTKALERKLGMSQEHDNGNPFARLSYVQICENLLTREGVNVGLIPNDPSSIIRETNRRASLGTGNNLAISASDLPIALGSLLNRRLEINAAGIQRTYTQWLTKQNQRDLRDAYIVQVANTGGFTAVDPTGKPKPGSVVESAESWHVNKMSKEINVEEKYLINDDLNTIMELVDSFGRDAIIAEETLAYSILLDNPLMGDGVALFDAGHKNIASAAALSTAALSAARLLMAKQTDIAGRPIMVDAWGLILGASNDDYANALLKTLGYVPNAAATAPVPWMRSLNIISSPIITNHASKSTYWWLVANPAAMKIGYYGYLEGREGAQIRSQIDFKTQDLSLIGELYFGVKAANYRGLVQNPYGG